MDYQAESAKRLRKARKDKDLSLEELSQRTNVPKLSKSRISNYEQGIRMMGPAEAISLGEALDVDPAHLLCVQQSVTKQESDLLRNWRALPENDRNEYSRRIEVLALAYREPVPDERMGKGWTSPSKRKKPAKTASK